MIVIDVLRVGRATDRTHPTLLRQQLFGLGIRDAVAVPQVVLARSAVEPLFCLPATSVVTGTAIRVIATLRRLGAREVDERLDLLAVGAPLRALGHRLGCSPLLLDPALTTAGLRPLSSALLAVEGQSVRPPGVPVKLAHRQRPTALRAVLKVRSP